MNMKRKITPIAAAVAAVCCCGAFAESSSAGDRYGRPADGGGARPWLPLGLSLVAPPFQLPSPDHTVFGAMVNLGYGQVENLYVLDLGLVNNVTHDMAGLEVGPVNLAGTCFGGQIGVVNYAGTVCGAQVGLVNVAGDLHGLQIGLLNFAAQGGAWAFPIFNLGF